VSVFKLPDLGEGLEEAQVVEWLVKPGDTVQLNQPICQVETAKALVDIPSPFEGTVQQLHARPGDTVEVGSALITIAEAGSPVPAGPQQPPTAPQRQGSGSVLVGYGTEGPPAGFIRRRRGVAGAVASAAETAHGLLPAVAAPTPALTGADAGKSSPLVRKMAAEKGIDLATIAGTGPGGRIRVEDLEAAIARGATMAVPQQRPIPAPAVSLPRPVAAPVPAADEERISTVGLRKAIAARMLKAATTIPHFTEYSLFDAAALGALRERLKADPAYAASRLTFLPFFVRALVEAVRQYPILNSRWDEEGNAIVVKKSIHVGIATDTARGLVVPVVRDANALTLAQIAAECSRLVGLARDGQLDARSLSGSTITITNVGAAGPVDTGAPLINPPEACVVGFGAIKTRPMVVGDQVLARPSCWLSLSADHRIVDGATAAQFMGALVQRLEAPAGLV
jgi:2-oxoisovalerate dehydrogenase E2 component (dihydrolipoyl transacylase)